MQPSKAILALCILVLAAASGASAQRSYPKPQIESAAGKPAPDFTLRDQDGKNFNLAAMQGKPVLLYFYRGYW